MHAMTRAVATLFAAACIVAGSANAAGMAAGRDVRRPDYRALYAKLEKADVVREGPKATKHVLYVFFDANCYYCHLTWKALQPYVKAGLQVRWVPVAYQQESSLARAAAIMQAPDPATALRKNETVFDLAQFSGGIAPLDKVPSALAAKLRANTRLMQEFGAPGTPALAWKGPDGTVRFEVGLPRLTALPRITGLPPQPEDDPELARALARFH
jgi:thiol:disulfide interchange protein DsbG